MACSMLAICWARTLPCAGWHFDVGVCHFASELPRARAQCELPVSPLDNILPAHHCWDKAIHLKLVTGFINAFLFSIYTAIKNLKKSLKFFRYPSLHFMRENKCCGSFINLGVFEGCRIYRLQISRGLWYITLIFQEMLPCSLDWKRFAANT